MADQTYDRDPRHGKRVFVMFTLQSGLKVTLQCTFDSHRFSSPSAQIMVERGTLFRRPVKLADVCEVEPKFRGCRRFILR